METILTIILSLLIISVAFVIGMNIGKTIAFQSAGKSKNVLDIVESISKDLSDDPATGIIVHSVFQGIEYAVDKYSYEDKDSLVMAGVCYTEEVLCRMGIEISNYREELIHEIFVIAYDILYYEKE